MFKSWSWDRLFFFCTFLQSLFTPVNSLDSHHFDLTWLMTVQWSRVSVLDITNALRTGQSGVRIPVGARDFTVLQSVQTGLGTHSVSFSVGTGVKTAGM